LLSSAIFEREIIEVGRYDNGGIGLTFGLVFLFDSCAALEERQSTS
jgi:hypothetical protein